MRSWGPQRLQDQSHEESCPEKRCERQLGCNQHFCNGQGADPGIGEWESDQEVKHAEKSSDADMRKEERPAFTKCGFPGGLSEFISGDFTEPK